MLISFKQLSLHLFLISTITKPAAVAPICTPGEAEGREWVLSQPELHWDFYASQPDFWSCRLRSGLEKKKKKRTKGKKQLPPRSNYSTNILRFRKEKRQLHYPILMTDCLVYSKGRQLFLPNRERLIPQEQKVQRRKYIFVYCLTIIAVWDTFVRRMRYETYL